MGDLPIPHIYRDCRIEVDGNGVYPSWFNPSLDSVDAAIADREEMITSSGPVPREKYFAKTKTTWYGHSLGVWKNLQGNQFHSFLHIESKVSLWDNWDVIVLSHLGSDICFVFDSGIHLDTKALKNLVISFLDGEEITETYPFKVRTIADFVNDDKTMGYWIISDDRTKI